LFRIESQFSNIIYHLKSGIKISRSKKQPTKSDKMKSKNDLNTFDQIIPWQFD